MHFRTRRGCEEQLCDGSARSRDVDRRVTQAREMSTWGSAGNLVQEGEEGLKSVLKPHKGSPGTARTS